MNITLQAVEDFQDRLMQTKNGCLWADRGYGKSYGLALRALMAGIDLPVIITSASLRQSRLVLKYLEDICQERQIDISSYNVRCVAVSSLQDEIKGMGNFLLLVDEFDTIPSEFRHIITSHDNWVGCASK